MSPAGIAVDPDIANDVHTRNSLPYSLCILTYASRIDSVIDGMNNIHLTIEYL